MRVYGHTDVVPRRSRKGPGKSLPLGHPGTASGLMGSSEFFDLLRKRNRENAQEIDRLIEARGLYELAVLACDSSGFSRKTHEYGILQFLAIMTKCYDRLIPILEHQGGICLTHNADNLLAVFADPAHSVQAAVDMCGWLRSYNKELPAYDQFDICIGIHFGQMVRLKRNVFGDTVNVAAKVGEDLAGRDEILITGVVADCVKERFDVEYSRSTELGGRTFELYRVLH
ncbi:MAG: adenylate/guanylate cyclase domain-containing protein [Armatimonadetes bacterium]|nr:adenylate/guanylate cyclase domain-containing protein [Armatimonadota bacterium]